MKRLLLFAALMITLTAASGQKSIDLLFDKYAGRDGFTTVTINGGLLNSPRGLIMKITTMTCRKALPRSEFWPRKTMI